MTKLILNKRIAQLAVAAVIGAIVGLVVFTIAQVTGRNLYIIIGGVAGAAAVLVLQQYWRTAQLTEVKITVPQVSELTFVVNNDARQVAWKLYIETVTRSPRSHCPTRKDSSGRLCRRYMAFSRPPETRSSPAVLRCLFQAVRLSSTWQSPCSITSCGHSFRSGIHGCAISRRRTLMTRNRPGLIT